MSAGLRAPSPLAVALAGTALLAAAMGIGRFAYTPLLPPMRVAFGWTVSDAGDVASANFLGYVLGALAAAWLAQRGARRAWLWLGMAASLASTAGGALAGSLGAWLALRFLSGVASALCLVIGTGMIVEYLARHARPGLGALHFAGVGGGIVASVAVIEALPGAAPVAAAWAALGLVTALLLAASGAVLRGLPGSAPAAPAARPAGALAAGVWPLILAYGAHGFGYVVTATFIVAIARGLPEARLLEPLVWLLVGLAAAPSVLVWQRVARRLGLRRALTLAHGIEAAGVLAAGAAGTPAAVLAGGVLLGATFMGITALGLSAAREALPERPEAAIGWMTAAFGLGQWLGPAAAGRLAEASGGFLLPSALAALLVLAGMLLLAAPAAGGGRR